jgi:putative adhesin
MLSVFAVTVGLTAFTLSPGADTTVAVPPGSSLNVENYSGEVFVEGWTRGAIRIRTDQDDEDRVVVVPARGFVTVRAASKHEEDHEANIRLQVPAWMNVSVNGVHTDVIVDGTKGQVKVETVHGDVIVRGGRRRIDLNTVNDDICVLDAAGVVRAETVNGDAYVWRTESDSVDVSTVNGDVVYEGSVRDNGVYRLASHNGDVAVAVPRDANAAVGVSTFAGDFESNIPVTLTGTHNPRRFQFCVGSCSARMDLQSFQGTVQIYRALGAASARVQRMDRIVGQVIAKRLDRSAERLDDLGSQIERATRALTKSLEKAQRKPHRPHESHEENVDKNGDGE